jgi:hypothetical protein
MALQHFSVHQRTGTQCDLVDDLSTEVLAASRIILEKCSSTESTVRNLQLSNDTDLVNLSLSASFVIQFPWWDPFGWDITM